MSNSSNNIFNLSSRSDSSTLSLNFLSIPSSSSFCSFRSDSVSTTDGCEKLLNIKYIKNQSPKNKIITKHQR